MSAVSAMRLVLTVAVLFLSGANAADISYGYVRNLLEVLDFEYFPSESSLMVYAMIICSVQKRREEPGNGRGL